jgi:hypothetical protein
MSADELDALYDLYSELAASAEDCLTKGRITPCLVLIYSGIDSIAALESGIATKDGFKAWVAKYLFTTSWSPCTPDDLYGARCGILHMFSANSDLSRAKIVRPIWYAYRDHKADDLKLFLDTMGKSIATIQLEALLERFLHGLATFMEDVRTDQTLEQKVRASAKQLLIKWRPA